MRGAVLVSLDETRTSIGMVLHAAGGRDGDAHPVPDGLEGVALIESIESLYVDQIKALSVAATLPAT